MLSIAKPFEKQLRINFLWANLDNTGIDANSFRLINEPTTCKEFVSITKSGEIIGFIRYYINKQDKVAYNFTIINLIDANQDIFAMDIKTVVQDLFEVDGMGKILFSVKTSHPKLKTYAHIVFRLGGSKLDKDNSDYNFYSITKDMYKNITKDTIKI